MVFFTRPKSQFHIIFGIPFMGTTTISIHTKGHTIQAFITNATKDHNKDTTKPRNKEQKRTVFVIKPQKLLTTTQWFVTMLHNFSYGTGVCAIDFFPSQLCRRVPTSWIILVLPTSVVIFLHFPWWTIFKYFVSSCPQLLWRLLSHRGMHYSSYQ